MSDFFSDYSNFIEHIKNVISDDKFFENLTSEPQEQQLERVKRFNDSLCTTTLLNHFIKNKIKLFSHKEKNTTIVSQSMFGEEVTLKKIFNNQDDSVKELFWTDLKYLLISYNKHILSINPDNKNAQDRIQILDAKQIINPKEGLNKILKTENLNETTNNMINDIFSTFEKTVGQPGANPFANIMEISKTISEKYKSNIENGEVNIDDLLANMTGLPGMENMNGIIGSLTKQMQISPEEPVEKVIIDENFSTAIVPRGEQKEDSNNINIGELLKTMDSLGLANPLMGLGGIKDENSMGKLMDVFGKLSNTTDPSQLNEIMETNLGIDMAKFTDEMSKVLGKND